MSSKQKTLCTNFSNQPITLSEGRSCSDDTYNEKDAPIKILRVVLIQVTAMFKLMTVLKFC